MTRVSGSPSRVLLYAGGIVTAAALAWAGASFVDLHDGSTWAKRPRGERGPMFRHVDATTNASDFKAIVMLRGVLPAVFFGTTGIILLLGAAGQHYVPRS